MERNGGERREGREDVGRDEKGGGREQEGQRE